MLSGVFFACSIFCAIYLATSTLMSFKALGKTVSFLVLIQANVYSQVMSIPLMPFMYHPDTTVVFSTTIISLYALSNIIWQTLYIIEATKVAPRKIIACLGACNMAGWIAMSVANYYLYTKVISMFSAA